jgi:hypothetical protein
MTYYEEQRRELVSSVVEYLGYEYWKPSELIKRRLDDANNDKQKIEMLASMMGRMCDILDLSTQQILDLTATHFYKVPDYKDN